MPKATNKKAAFRWKIVLLLLGYVAGGFLALSCCGCATASPASKSAKDDPASLSVPPPPMVPPEGQKLLQKEVDKALKDSGLDYIPLTREQWFIVRLRQERRKMRIAQLKRHLQNAEKILRIKVKGERDKRRIEIIQWKKALDAANREKLVLWILIGTMGILVVGGVIGGISIGKAL